jgi:hypothetical protein
MVSDSFMADLVANRSSAAIQKLRATHEIAEMDFSLRWIASM